MTQCVQSTPFVKRRNHWQDKRQRMLKKMDNMRSAKERKRLSNPVEREPKLTPWFPIELGLRDKISGDVAWVDFRGLRDALRRLSVVQKHYVAGQRTNTAFYDSRLRHMQKSTRSQPDRP